MFSKKIIVLLSFIGLLGTTLCAKQDPDMVRYKDYKEKEPSTVQKKTNNSGPAPKGTKMKLVKGQIVDENFLNMGSMINTNKYPNIKNTDIYRVKDKVFRISTRTREILDILN